MSGDQSLRKAIMMEEGKVSPSNYKKKLGEQKKECYKVLIFKFHLNYEFN